MTRRYDIPFWRSYWRRTEIKGIIVNAGGIVLIIPVRFLCIGRSEYLGDRDLFGEICHAAHEDGMAVFARWIQASHEEFYQAHPDWLQWMVMESLIKRRPVYHVYQ